MPRPDISAKTLTIGASALTVLVAAIAVFVCGTSNRWQLTHLSIYQIFPLLGLLAFSIMWSQYIAEAAKNALGLPGAIQRYFQVTGWLVLGAILLHPGMLIVQRYRDGYGLPPRSYESYVAPMNAWLTILGSASLLIFLAFEFKRMFGTKPWWHYITSLSDVAMVAIFYHGLRLGTQLQQGWFQAVWLFYGLTLLMALGYKYYCLLKKRPTTKSDLNQPT